MGFKMLNKITLTQKQMQEAVEYWLNGKILRVPQKITHVEKITDGVCGTKFEVTLTESNGEQDA